MPVNFVSRKELRAAPKLSSNEDEENAIGSDARAHAMVVGKQCQNVQFRVPLKRMPVSGCSLLDT